jgi:ribonuclease BN (tRNA processing enzyme)
MAHHSRREAEIHSSGRDAGAVAREAGVQRLVLIHLSPLGGHDVLLEEAREQFPRAELAYDGLELEL